MTAEDIEVDEDGGVRGLEPAYRDVDGIRTRYYDVGSGEPVVLLHGGNWRGSSSANYWSTNVEGLGASFRVLAPDRVGCGLTDNPDRVEDYVFAREIHHVVAFIEELTDGPCHLVGASRGAGLAGRVAVERPDLVASLVVVNSNTLALGFDVGDYGYRRDRLERGMPTDDLVEELRYLYELYSYDTGHISEEELHTAAELRETPKARETARVMHEEGALERWEASLREEMETVHRRLKEPDIDLPTLVFWGRNDLTVRFGTAETLYNLFAGNCSVARLYALNRCGHFSWRERPAEFHAQVGTFVETAAGHP